MYGGYHPDFDLESQKSILSRLIDFFTSKCVTHRPSGENRSTGLKQGKFGKIGGATLLIFLFGMLFVGGCKPQQVIVEKEKVVYVHSDSTIYKDSVVYVPVEVYKDYSKLNDTLYLETSLAKAAAWNDTVGWTIQGYIRNKQAVQYKYIEVEKIVKNDSIVEKEVPVPYEVEVVKTRIPTWAWLCLAWAVISLLSIAWTIYKKFRVV